LHEQKNSKTLVVKEKTSEQKISKIFVEEEKTPEQKHC